MRYLFALLFVAVSLRLCLCWNSHISLRQSTPAIFHHLTPHLSQMIAMQQSDFNISEAASMGATNDGSVDGNDLLLLLELPLRGE